MNLFKRKPVNDALTREWAAKGAAIREMMQHPAGAIIEQRLREETEWVRAEWSRMIDADPFDLPQKQAEYRAYLKALQLMESMFLGLPKIGWRAEDKLLAFANRSEPYTRQ